MHVTPTDRGVRIEVESEAETDRVGRALAPLLVPGTVIGLSGPLGAGKTRLVRAIATALGVDPNAVTSPTFVLIQEYDGRLPVYHFDTYRLANAEEFEALGPWEYYDQGGVCLIEWADRVTEHLPPDSWMIRLVPEGAERRGLTIELPAAPTKVTPRQIAEALTAV
jgi:tRNA threonylcarbamoyladenosine biosynthesis protein TsaE